MANFEELEKKLPQDFLVKVKAKNISPVNYDVKELVSNTLEGFSAPTPEVKALIQQLRSKTRAEWLAQHAEPVFNKPKEKASVFGAFGLFRKKNEKPLDKNTLQNSNSSLNKKP